MHSLVPFAPGRAPTLNHFIVTPTTATFPSTFAIDFHFRTEMEHATTFLGWIGKQPAATVWAIEVEGEAAGGIGIELHTDVERVSAEIGYWLGERYWRRGIATEALQAVTAEAFKQFEITRLYAVPFADHVASVRVLEKAGYVKEGHLRQSAIKDGKVRDQCLYASYKPL